MVTVIPTVEVVAAISATVAAAGAPTVAHVASAAASTMAAVIAKATPTVDVAAAPTWLLWQLQLFVMSVLQLLLQ